MLTSCLSMIFKTPPITPLNPGAGTEFKVFSKSSRANLTEFNQGKPSARGCLGVGSSSSQTDSEVMGTSGGWPSVSAVEADGFAVCSICSGAGRGPFVVAGTSSASDGSIASLADPRDGFLGGLVKICLRILLAFTVDLLRNLAMIWIQFHRQGPRAK